MYAGSSKDYFRVSRCGARMVWLWWYCCWRCGVYGCGGIVVGVVVFMGVWVEVMLLCRFKGGGCGIILFVFGCFWFVLCGVVVGDVG